MRALRRITALLCAFLIFATPFIAQAEQGLFGGRPNPDGSVNMRSSTTEQYEPARGQSVAARPRPDFDATPITMGSFQLFTAFNEAVYYDSNIYASQHNPAGDAVNKINPGVSVVSNWGRHALAFTGFADINNYIFNPSEDFVGGAAQIDGRFDIAPRTWLAANLSYQRNTEPRSSPSSPTSAAEPVQYNLVGASFEVYRGVGKLKAKGNYDFSFYDYNDVKLMSGAIATQKQRSRVGNGLRGEVQYAVSENVKPFVRVGFDMRRYTDNALRHSDGFDVAVGSYFDMGGIVTADIYTGLTGRDYYNFSDGMIAAANFGGHLLWNVTELTSLQFEAGRTIEETTWGGVSVPAASSAYIATGGSVTVTHELRRDMLVEANASYTNDAYKKSNRSDDNYTLGLGTRYFINRNFYSDVTYDFMKRISNVNDNGYNRHVFLVRFGAQY